MSIYKSRTTPGHGLRRGFSTPCYRRIKTSAKPTAPSAMDSMTHIRNVRGSGVPAFFFDLPNDL
jgi:hypothetical protein